MKTEVQRFQGGLSSLRIGNLLSSTDDIQRAAFVEGRGTLVTPSYYRELPSGLDNLLIFKFVFRFLSLQLT